MLDIQSLDKSSFAFADLIGQDKWTTWTPTYSFATATGLTVIGRFKLVGRQCFFQAYSQGTSLATTAGASYIALPIPAAGLSGVGVMTDETANQAVGLGHLDVTTSRLYLPTQAASGNTFVFAGWYEVA